MELDMTSQGTDGEREEGIFYPESVAKQWGPCCEECNDVHFEKTYPAHTPYLACRNLKCYCHTPPQGQCCEKCRYLPHANMLHPEQKLVCCNSVCPCHQRTVKEDKPTPDLVDGEASTINYLSTPKEEFVGYAKSHLPTTQTTNMVPTPKSLRDEIVEEFLRRFVMAGATHMLTTTNNTDEMQELVSWLTSALDRIEAAAGKHFTDELAIVRAEGYNAGIEAERSRILAVLNSIPEYDAYNTEAHAITHNKLLRFIRSLISPPITSNEKEV